MLNLELNEVKATKDEEVEEVGALTVEWEVVDFREVSDEVHTNDIWAANYNR